MALRQIVQDSGLGLTFDDVLLVPGASEVMPGEVNVTSRITKSIPVNIPIISAAMDTVTEARLAIAIAQAGGIGVIHRNLTPEVQADHVRQVKKYESGIVLDPVTIGPDAKLSVALELMRRFDISGIPVVEPKRDGQKTGRLAGIVTNRDVRFATNLDQPVSELMTKDKLVTVKRTVSQEDARRLLHQHRIEKLLVVDDDYHCIGLITVKDIEKARKHPNACKDEQGRLRVAAATTVGEDGYRRTELLVAAGCDLIVVDTAHGHSKRVLEAVTRIKKLSNNAQVIAGNVATADATKALIDAGADCVKVGIGPGSICTTRIVAGVGVPQLTAIDGCAEAAHKQGIPIIADGGIKFSGDIAKAIAAGADVVMLGSLFAGVDESPGEVAYENGKPFKRYRGMGSLGAMSARSFSKDRYFQESVSDVDKIVPEGVEGMVPYRGPLREVVHQTVGGLRQAMGYCGVPPIEAMKAETRFVRVTPASLLESHPHDLFNVAEAPNYRGR